MAVIDAVQSAVHSAVWDATVGPYGGAPVAGFDPADLFSTEAGGFYNINDTSTLFQERTGASATTPSTVNTVVGTIRDLSGNDNHLTAPSDNARGILRVDGNGKYYIEMDGIDDTYVCASFCSFSTGNFTYLATSKRTGTPASGGELHMLRAGQSFTYGNDVLMVMNVNTTFDWRVYTTSDYGSKILTGAAPATNNIPETSWIHQSSTGTNDTAIGIAHSSQEQTGVYTNTISSVSADLYVSRGLYGSYHPMDFYGMFFIEKDLSASQFSDVKNYFANLSGTELP